MNNIKKATIIGANSYIARNLIKNMNSDMYDIFLYDKDVSQKDGFCNYAQIDILDEASIQDVCFDCDFIFYFAGITGTEQGFIDYENYVDVNEKGVLNMLTVYVQKQSSAKIIYPSTRLVYKGSNEALVESSEKEFKTIYAVNKYACEQYLSMYANMYGINYLILRICVPYGNDVDDTFSYGTIGFLINSALRRNEITIYGDGNQKRTFTHIKDLCDIILASANSSQCINDAFNIGGQTFTLFEVASKIGNHYGVSVNNTPWPCNALRLESGSTVFNSHKLDTLLNTEYKFDFERWIGSLTVIKSLSDRKEDNK